MHDFALSESVLGRLSRAEGDVVVGLRPEDFVLGGNEDFAVPAAVEISERLGPEVLVHLRAVGLEAAANEETSELRDAIVARFGAEFAGRAGETVMLGIKRENLQLFDPLSGASLL